MSQSGEGPPTTKVYISTAEFARRCGRAVSTVHTWVRDGKLTPDRTSPTNGAMEFDERKVAVFAPRPVEAGG